jgi:hypothetical protein
MTTQRAVSLRSIQASGLGAASALVTAICTGLCHSTCHSQARFRPPGGPPMTAYISASHRDVEVDAQLRESATAALLAREKARDAQRAAARQPAIIAAPKQTVAKSTPPPKKPKPKPLRAQSSPQATPAPPAPTVTAAVPELPPGSVVLSAADMEAVDIAVSYFVANHPMPRGHR